MDAIHDLGGKAGFGAVVREKHEPVFHARWEAKVFALMRASGAAGAFLNTDRFRHLVERINPVAYLTHGYYGRWLGGVETGLVESGILDVDAIAAKVSDLGGEQQSLIAAQPKSNPDSQGNVPTAVGSDRAVAAPKFAVGQQVLTSALAKPGHTRLPAYARAKIGTVITTHGGWVYPDTNAHGLGEDPQNLYTVQFTSATLWGGSEKKVKVSLDLFEPYLSPV
jgi:nitrile hydratase beta subunit